MQDGVDEEGSVDHGRRPKPFSDNTFDGVNVIDITDPGDGRVDDFRDLNSVDRRPDLPTGKGLVIAESIESA